MNIKLKTLFTALFITLFSMSSYAGSAWDPYVVKLHQYANCKQAGIFGLSDGVQWGGQLEFNPIATEVMAVIKGFNNPAILYANGPVLKGIKYMALEASQDIITLKNGTKVIYVAHSRKAVSFCLIEGALNPNARTGTMNFASFMTSVGF